MKNKLIWLLFLLAVGIASPLQAQDDSISTPTDPHNVPDLSLMEHTRALSLIAHEFTVEFEATHDFARDYQVVYLITENALAPDALISPENILAALPTIKVIHHWDDFRAFVDKTPVDGLVIHGSAIEWIDPEWTQNAYAHGSPIITLDSNFYGWATATGNYCEYPLSRLDDKANPFTYNPGYDPSKGHVLLSGIWVMRIDDESKRLEAADVELRQCKDALDEKYTTIGISESISNDYIVDVEDFELLTRRISGSVVWVDMMQNWHIVEERQNAYVIEHNLINVDGE